MLLPLILILIRKKMYKNAYNNLGCLIYTNKNYMKLFVITQNKKSSVKVCPEYLYDTSIEGYCSLMMHSNEQDLHNSL